MSVQVEAKFGKVCRTCLSEGITMKKIFDLDGEASIRYHEMIMSCTQIVIREDDGLPSLLCENCAAKVSNLFSFKSQCENVDANLRQYLQDPLRGLNTKSHGVSSTQKTPDNEENALLFVNMDDSLASSDCNYYLEDRKRCNNTRPKINSFIKKAINKNNVIGLNTKKKKLSSGVDNLRVMAIKKNLSNASIKTLNKKVSQTRALQSNEETSSVSNEQIDLVIEEAHNDIKMNNSKKNKRVSSAVAFPCRKCDLHFLTWGELDRHNSQHMPEESNQKLSCKYCGKVFLHQRHINPHIRKMHSDIERFQCGYCGNRWKDVRILKIHLTKHYDEHFSSQFDDKTKQIEMNEDAHINNLISIDDVASVPKEDKHSTEKLILDSPDNKVDQETLDQNRSIENTVKDVFSTKADNLICYSCRQLFIDLESLESHIITTHIESENVSYGSLNLTKSTINNTSSEFGNNIVESSKANTNFNCTSSDFIEENIIALGNNNDTPEIANLNILSSISEEQIVDQVKNNVSTFDEHSQDLLLIKNMKKFKNKCTICNKVFKSLNDLKRHEATHDPDKPFHCQFGRCRWSFASEHELAVHTNVNHSDGTHECRFCHKIFKHARNLRQHMLQHQLTKRFECKHCSKGFNHLHHLQNHERIHTGDLPFLCQECGRAFATKDRLIFHIRRHSDVRPFNCNECGKKFVSTADLKVHSKTHTGDRPYMCSVCGKTFTARYNLNKHSKAQHAGVGSGSLKSNNKGGDRHEQIISACNICGFLAETLQQLDQHMKTHTCQYFCPMCPKSFPLTSALEAHIKTHSMGDRSHACNTCGWAFNRAEHLRAHIARRHSIGGRTLTCSRCPRTFTRLPDLTAHARIHDHRKPYICTECGRGFSQSGALRVHLRIHSGERPYICGVCHRAHRSAGALAAHMRTHSSNVPHTSAISTEIKTAAENSSAITSSQINIEPTEVPTALNVIDVPTTVTSISFQEMNEISDSPENLNLSANLNMEKQMPTMTLDQLVTRDENINIMQTVDNNGEIIYNHNENGQFSLHENME